MCVDFAEAIEYRAFDGMILDVVVIKVWVSDIEME
jgi:hypothetical protein